MRRRCLKMHHSMSFGVNVGTYEGNRGYDLAWKKWDPVPAGETGK